jgi:uncharacterized protein (DUF433 family)
VRGTRVPVRALIGGLAGGMTIEEVCASYRVGEDDVRAALRYAALVLGEERALGSAPWATGPRVAFDGSDSRP